MAQEHPAESASVIATMASSLTTLNSHARAMSPAHASRRLWI